MAGGAGNRCSSLQREMIPESQQEKEKGRMPGMEVERNGKSRMRAGTPI